MPLKTLLEKDQHYTQRLRLSDDKPGIKKIAAFFAHSGDSWFWGVALVLLWFFGLEVWRPQVKLLFVGIFFTAVSVLVLKFSFKRPRPEGEWGQIYRSTDPHSFPSGHAARAIMLTTIMLLTGYIWIGIIMIIWALLVCLARIGLGVHYISDIVVGSLIGIFMGVLVVVIF
jgi:undecaprenyl-diphosphatase